MHTEPQRWTPEWLTELQQRLTLWSNIKASLGSFPGAELRHGPVRNVVCDANEVSCNSVKRSTSGVLCHFMVWISHYPIHPKAVGHNLMETGETPKKIYLKYQQWSVYDPSKFRIVVTISRFSWLVFYPSLKINFGCFFLWTEPLSTLERGKKHITGTFGPCWMKKWNSSWHHTLLIYFAAFSKRAA